RPSRSRSGATTRRPSAWPTRCSLASDPRITSRGVELRDALRTTGAIREFQDEPVPDEVLYRVLDTARFAPSGGNRQGWRIVVVKDREIRRRLRDLYLPGW